MLMFAIIRPICDKRAAAYYPLLIHKEAAQAYAAGIDPLYFGVYSIALYTQSFENIAYLSKKIPNIV